MRENGRRVGEPSGEKGDDDKDRCINRWMDNSGDTWGVSPTNRTKPTLPKARDQTGKDAQEESGKEEWRLCQDYMDGGQGKISTEMQGIHDDKGTSVAAEYGEGHRSEELIISMDGAAELTTKDWGIDTTRRRSPD